MHKSDYHVVYAKLTGSQISPRINAATLTGSKQRFGPLFGSDKVRFIFPNDDQGLRMYQIPQYWHHSEQTVDLLSPATCKVDSGHLHLPRAYYFFGDQTHDQSRPPAVHTSPNHCYSEWVGQSFRISQITNLTPSLHLPPLAQTVMGLR